MLISLAPLQIASAAGTAFAIVTAPTNKVLVQYPADQPGNTTFIGFQADSLISVDFDPTATTLWSINFSAHSTQRQSVILPAYTAAKAMVTSISKNLSLALAPDEIMVNVVSPGSILSESLAGWADSVGIDGTDPYAVMAGIDKHFGHPAHLPRAGKPEEIGPVVAFLVSRRNSYMTGANINVDGGSDFT